MQKQQAVISIIGRPNVGKSCLFNRIVGKRIAVVHNEPGVTRDRNYQLCSWNGYDFTMVDTGGMVPSSKKVMERLVYEQVQIAVDESLLILFVVDAITGVTDLDLSIAKLLKRSCKEEVILVANKSESESAKANLAEYIRLGLGEPYPVSAIHGRNVADLLDLITDRIKNGKPIKTSLQEEIRIAVLGRPNSGKSSLVNSFCRTRRMIVDDKPGTTRDAVDVRLEHEGTRYVIIDTAGLRKKANVNDDVEYYTNIRAVSSIDRCDVALIMVDAERSLEEQDCRIITLLLERGKGMVIVLNKWDIVEKDHKTFDHMVRNINEFFPDLKFIPKISTSALTGQRIWKALELLKEVYEKSGAMLEKREFKENISKLVMKSPPPAKAKRPIRIYSIEQEGVFPPTFVGRCNYPKNIREPYTRFIRNHIVERYSLDGCAVRVKWKSNRGSVKSYDKKRMKKQTTEQNTEGMQERKNHGDHREFSCSAFGG